MDAHEIIEYYDNIDNAIDTLRSVCAEHEDCLDCPLHLITINGIPHCRLNQTPYTWKNFSDYDIGEIVDEE